MSDPNVLANADDLASLSDDASTPETRIRALIRVTDSLSEIFARENDCLATEKPGEIIPLQAEKARLATAYATAIRTVAVNRETMAGANLDLLAELRAATDRFNGLAARQQALLSGLAAAGEGVVKSVAGEAADQGCGEAPGALSVNERA